MATAEPTLMDSPERLCEANLSNPSTQASEDEWELVTETGDPLDQEVSDQVAEPLAVPLDALADHFKSLRHFAKRALETCKHSEVQIFKEACHRLEEMSRSCDQQDRLIIAGSGNVGKSSIANALLGGKKFWPTAKHCMTSRICEAHYNAEADGKPIPKEEVQKSDTPDQKLRVWNPSHFLKHGVILVDLPGLDQETGYMEKLDEYMQSHPASSVVLFYVIDVKNKICNPDRDFFGKLMKSPWMVLSQSLRLLVNKCDVEVDGCGASSDEEIPDYAKLISEITRDVQNYCTPKVLDLSLKDKKKNHEEALVKWQKIEEDAGSALAQLKCIRLDHILSSLDKVADVLKWAAGEAQDAERQARIETKQTLVRKAQTALKMLEASKDDWTQRRAQEVRKALQGRREEHFQAILKAGVPHWQNQVGDAELQEVDRFIAERLETMAANDSLVSFLDLGRLAASVVSLAAIFPVGTGPLMLLSAVEVGAGAAALAGFLTGGAVVAALVVAYGIAHATMAKKHVDQDYVRGRFDALFAKKLKAVNQFTAQEFDLMVTLAKADVAEKQRDLETLEATDSQVMLDADFMKECSQLVEQFAALKTSCESILGLAKQAGVL